jgi:hypothetical protein
MPSHTPPANPPFTLPAVPTFSTFGDTAQSWACIASFYADLASRNAVFADLASLAAAISASEFPAAGLCGLTSMHDIVLGPSTRVLDNPHLLIRYDFERRSFRFEYLDGSRTPWSRTAAPAEAFAALDRFLTRRVRWFHRNGTV